MNRISLCNVDLGRDMNLMREYLSNEDSYLFSTKVLYNSKMSFEDWFRQHLATDFHDFFMVTKEDRPIGYVHDYEFSLQDGHCKIVVYIDGENRKMGIGAEAAIRFMRYLFDTYPLRKIYITIYDYNKESLTSNLKAGFREEGILKSYRYFDGQYVDLHMLAMTREDFDIRLRNLVD